jgi:hypothetical protein
MTPDAELFGQQKRPPEATLLHRKSANDGSLMHPRCKLGVCELTYPSLVAVQVLLVEQMPPLAAGAFIEEPRVVVPDRLG